MFDTEMAARLIIKLIKEYADHFSSEDRLIIAETIEYWVILGTNSKRTEEEEDMFKDICITFHFILNKAKSSFINMAEEYTNIGKIIELLISCI